jgi:hypothetical protein
MRTNGFFQYETTKPGGFNEYGEPTEAITTWSEPIKCSIKANSDTRKGRYEDGIFRQASYIVLTECRELTNCKRIRLTRHSEDLGEKDVLNIEPLTTVGRLQILV